MDIVLQRNRTIFVLFLILSWFLIVTESFSQVTVRIMSYNLNDYTSGSSRNTALKSVITPIDPDIFVGIELTSSTQAGNFRDNVLNQTGNGTYSMGTFLLNSNGPNDNNVIYYKSSFSESAPPTNVINTGNHPTYKFTLTHTSGRQIIIFGVHFTSSTATNPQLKRYTEATAIRSITSGLTNGEFFIALGDFNIANANEVVPSTSNGAFKTLVNTSSSGYFIDPAGFTGSGDWSGSTGLRTFDLLGGGFISRFDLMLNSQSVVTSGGVEYRIGTFTIAGNTNGTLGGVPTNYITASDHLPVYADYYFYEIPAPVELSSFNGVLSGYQVDLHWRTETEVNNYGFNIERSSSSLGTSWETIGFVNGNGNSNSPKFYNFTDKDIQISGTYNYRLKQTDNDGTFDYSKVVSVDVSMPGSYYLSQNYPNPFNPETKIDFNIPEKQMVTLRVYNTLGEQVADLINEEKDAGSYSVTFDASNLPSGIYIYRLTAQKTVLNNKMTVLK